MAIATATGYDTAKDQIKADSVLSTHKLNMVVPLYPQFMSTAGDGPPDVPTTTSQNELECISCATPIQNTDVSNPCVSAKVTTK